jgi:TonB family protein
LLHRTPIEYPRAAMERGVQGTVIVRATLDEKGNVTDAQVVSGPEILRRAALRSVLDWHYSRAAGSPSSVDVAIDFTLPAAREGSAASTEMERRRMAQKMESAGIEGSSIRGIRYSPMPDQLREELARRLPVREGDQIDEAKMTQLRELAREIDEHIGVGLMMSAEGGNRSVTINFTFPPSPMETSPDRIRVGGNVQANNLIQKAPVKYPPLAKQARIQGTVRFSATIGKDGTVKNLEVISGHPLLVEAAQEGVRQWVYRPTLLNGNPVEVITQVDVNFSLQGEPPPPAL